MLIDAEATRTSVTTSPGRIRVCLRSECSRNVLTFSIFFHFRIEQV